MLPLGGGACFEGRKRRLELFAGDESPEAEGRPAGDLQTHALRSALKERPKGDGTRSDGPYVRMLRPGALEALEPHFMAFEAVSSSRNAGAHG